MFCYLCFCQKVKVCVITKNMFQFSSFLSNNNDNNNSNRKINSLKQFRKKNPYKVLIIVPKWSIFCFYLRSILMGLWVIVKWTFQFLWSSLSQVHWCSHKNNYISSSDYYGGLHDKPPPCLVDNRLGLQSYVKLKGTKLHYIEAGSRSDPLILLLHGFPDCWLGWHNQIKEFSRFFRVVALDLKGFNDSDKPVWRKEYTPDKICNELFQFIKSLGCNSATIIGHDIGAVVGWYFAHTHPDNTDRFICVSASHPNLMWTNLHSKHQINDSWLKFVQIPYLPEIEMTRNDPTFIEKAMPHLQSNKKLNESHDEHSINILDAYKYVFSRKNDWTGPLNYYRNFPFYRIKAGETIRCPCLIVVGNEDTFCRLDAVVKSTEYCDNFIVKIIENAGHWPHQEMASEFNQVILKFLVGQRANQTTLALNKNNRGLMGRMLGAVTNSVKIGTYVLDSVQQRTNDVIQSALHN